MNYSSWKDWVSLLPWSRRWFVFLILLRPIIDNFHYIKEISPFYSPLYIVGILTPFLIFLTFVFKRSKHIYFTLTDKLFFIWSFFLCLNCFSLLFNQPNLEALGQVLKILTPIYIFFYLRYFIRSKDDLENILQTGIYAAIMPAIMLLYEVIFSPIQTQYSRGIKRMYGGYGDVANYAFYIMLTILIFGYYKLTPKKKIFLSKEKLKILLIFIICLLGLIRIAHATTYGVFVALLALFSWYTLKYKRVKGVISIVIIVSLGYFFFKGVYKERISPLVESEIKILKGERAIESIAHGRGIRWISRIEIFNELPIIVKFFGPPISNRDDSSILWSGNPHNDFLRILFLTGLFGLLSYLLILIRIYIIGNSFPLAERFLLRGALLIVIMFSIAANTMIYNPLLYIILAIFAYTCLPRSRQTNFAF